MPGEEIGFLMGLEKLAVCEKKAREQNVQNGQMKTFHMTSESQLKNKVGFCSFVVLCM
jgi:hypothetical protein